jgi:hypothetical protein
VNSAEEVATLLSALRAGTVSRLDEVADRFRRRSWPRSGWPQAKTREERAARILYDPPPDVPGSVDDVVAAYDRRELTREQYRVVMHAAACGISAQARRERAADERA